MAIDVLDLRDLIHKWFNAPMRRLEERCRRAQWKSLAVDVLLQLSLGYTLVVIVSIVEMALLSTFWGGERPKFAQLVHDYIHFDFLAWSPLVIPIMYIVNKFRFTYYEAARDEIGAGNERILHAIKQATDDAALRISLLKNVLLLPERARRELLSVCSRARMIGRQGDNLEATHWSNLYVAFVITMQMEPWIAVNTENAEFTFVRDIAQLRHQSG